MNEKTINEHGSYENGKAFYYQRIDKLNEELPTLLKEGKIYDSVVVMEEIEFAKLHLLHLERRKEKGLIK